MKEKIEKLKEIISDSNELLNYSDEIQNNWTENQLNEFILKILTDFKKYKDKPERPAFYTDLQTLHNPYNKDNSYKKPLME